MSGSRGVRVVDGFTAMKAAQRASAKTAPRHPSSPERKEEKGAERTGTHFRHTVMPTRYEVVCYECGFSFEQTGRAQSTQCLKCRSTLDFIDYTIDGEWTEPLKTAGTITITPEGVLKTGMLIGGNIILEGRIEGGSIEATQILEIRPGSVFEEKDVIGRDLRIADGLELTLKRKAKFRHVEIAGNLKAKLYTTGLVTIQAAGLLQGEIHGEHLAVEEGGGLKAKVFVEPIQC